MNDRHLPFALASVYVPAMWDKTFWTKKLKEAARDAICSWFTEGFDTADLTALLEEPA
jgi:hypothetical protein